MIERMTRDAPPASHLGLVRLIEGFERRHKPVLVDFLKHLTGLKSSEMQERLTNLQDSGAVLIEGESVRIRPQPPKLP